MNTRERFTFIEDMAEANMARHGREDGTWANRDAAVGFEAGALWARAHLSPPDPATTEKADEAIRRAREAAWNEGFEAGEGNGHAIGRGYDNPEDTSNPLRGEAMTDTDRSVERAVRELHAPRCHGMRDREGSPVDSCDHCYGPDGYNATYPCATIQALDAARATGRDEEKR